MTHKFLTGIDVVSNKITSVADPTVATDGATKNYVDTQTNIWRPVFSRSETNPGNLTGASANNQFQNYGIYGRSVQQVMNNATGVTSIKMLFWNGYTINATPGEVGGANQITLRASVEYPAGRWKQVSGSTAWSSTTAYAVYDQVTSGSSAWVCTQANTNNTPGAGSAYWTQVTNVPVHFTGEDVNRWVTLASNATAMSLPLTVPGLTPGQYVAVNVMVNTGSSTNYWCAGDIANTSSPGFDFATTYTTAPPAGGATDPVDSFVTNQTLSASNAIPLPIVTLGLNPPDPHATFIIGDSIVWGRGDTIDNERRGYAKRLMEDYGWLVSAKDGAQAVQTTSANGNTVRYSLAQYCDSAIVHFGTNECNAGTAFATIQTQLQQLWSDLASRGLRVWQSTITPITQSSDNWATTTNQTPGATWSLTNWVSFNRWIRDDAPITINGSTLRAGQPGHPLVGTIDVAKFPVDSTTQWKWSPGYVATSPASDQNHISSAGIAVVASQLRFQAKMISNPYPHKYQIDRLLPNLNNQVSWTMPLEVSTSTFIPTSGVIYLMKFWWPGGTMVGCTAYLLNPNSGNVAGQNFTGVYTLDGTQLAVTGDQSSAWSVAGEKDMAFSVWNYISPGEYYLAFVSNATTNPSFAASTSLAHTNLSVNHPLWRAASYATTGQTSLPSTLALLGTVSSGANNVPGMSKMNQTVFFGIS